MSAFDDEFGLFDDEAPVEEERKSTLGARKVATAETVIDEIEPEDEGDATARRPRRNGPPVRNGAPSGNGGPGGRRRPYDRERSSQPNEAIRERAVGLLDFLARGLVTKPEFIHVEAHDDPRHGLLLELEVAGDDLGKIIGRGGRVAQALRTVVRAGAEGRVAIEIIDVETDDDVTDEGTLPDEGVAGEENRTFVVSGDDGEEADGTDDAAEGSAPGEAASTEEAAGQARRRRRGRRGRGGRNRKRESTDGVVAGADGSVAADENAPASEALSAPITGELDHEEAAPASSDGTARRPRTARKPRATTAAPAVDVSDAIVDTEVVSAAAPAARRPRTRRSAEPVDEPQS